MNLRQLATAAFLSASMAAGPVAGEAYFAVKAADAQVTGDWYLRTFGLSEVNRLRADRYDIRILSSPSLIVEVIQDKPGLPAPGPETLGLAKAGVGVDDFDTTISRWRAQGVRFHGGEPRIFYDKALKRHSVLLVDPDGVLVQVFGDSRSAPRD